MPFLVSISRVAPTASPQRRQRILRFRCVMPAAGVCYHRRMFNFGKPKTAGDWIVHIAGAIVAIFLVWWMLRMYVL
jgi:hypothetical protein